MKFSEDYQLTASMLRQISIPVGVVLRRSPGVTRWAKWHWKPAAVLPGAAPANWQIMREEDGVTEYHASTLTLELHRKETEAYLATLTLEPPSIYVILRPAEDADHPHDVEPFAVTASAFEAQDYLDSGEEVVEPVPAPPGLIAWIREFTDAHHVEEEFIKRKRRNWSDQVEDGKGDARIRQDADVYRTPGSLKPKSVH